jgi:hypothetical protein
MSDLKRQNHISPPPTCKASRFCGAPAWRRDPRFGPFDVIVKDAEDTRVVPGYFDRDKKGTPAGLTFTNKMRQGCVTYIQDLVEDFNLRSSTVPFAINYFDRWYTKVCLDKHAKQDRIDRSWDLHVNVVTRMLAKRVENADCVSHVMSLLLKPVPTQEEVAKRNKDMRRTLKVGLCVCVLMAAKFDDVQLPTLKCLMKVCDEDDIAKNVSRNELMNLELSILDVLGWKLNAKSPYTYIDDLIGFCEETPEEGAFKNMVEGYIYDSFKCYGLLKFHPVVVASACLLKACQMFDIEEYKFDKYHFTLASACNTKVEEVCHALETLNTESKEIWNP